MTKDCNGGADSARNVICKRHADSHPVQEIVNGVTQQNHPHHRFKITNAQLLWLGGGRVSVNSLFGDVVLLILTVM